MSRLTDKEWVDITRKTIENYNTGHLRLGQSYMNALGDINIDLYKEVTATEYDCFYNDNKIVKLIEFLNNKNIKAKKEEL
jgi:hypothetical protein